MKIARTALASCIAACAVQPLVLFLSVVLPRLVTGGDPLVDVWFVFSALAGFYAAPFAIVLGIPLALVLWREGQLRWWPLAVVGTVAAAGFGSCLLLSGVLVVDAGAEEATSLGVARTILIFACHGLIGASAFYRVWVRGIGRGPATESQPRGSAD